MKLGKNSTNPLNGEAARMTDVVYKTMNSTANDF